MRYYRRTPPVAKLIPYAFLAAALALVALTLPRLQRATAAFNRDIREDERQLRALANNGPAGAPAVLRDDIARLQRRRERLQTRLFGGSTADDLPAEFFMRPMLYVRQRCTAMQIDALARLGEAGVNVDTAARRFGFTLPDSHSFPEEQCRQWLRQIETAARAVNLLVAVQTDPERPAATPPPILALRRMRSQEFSPVDREPTPGLKAREYMVEIEILATLDGIQALLRKTEGNPDAPLVRSLTMRFAADQESGGARLAPDGDHADRVVRYHEATLRMGVLIRPYVPALPPAMPGLGFPMPPDPAAPNPNRPGASLPPNGDP